MLFQCCSNVVPTTAHVAQTQMEVLHCLKQCTATSQFVILFGKLNGNKFRGLYAVAPKQQGGVGRYVKRGKRVGCRVWWWWWWCGCGFVVWVVYCFGCCIVLQWCGGGRWHSMPECFDLLCFVVFAFSCCTVLTIALPLFDQTVCPSRLLAAFVLAVTNCLVRAPGELNRK